ncbi:unnamed protein product [Prorocentrum cordatum]|uniref:Uncharacterized protein n=1 Tax=Prorocentrum cordatum TaxID=2364126 RepID=A0ABN9WEI6_9DINO|nr:unnamed protein product [Polarella glacialis]
MFGSSGCRSALAVQVIFIGLLFGLICPRRSTMQPKIGVRYRIRAVTANGWYLSAFHNEEGDTRNECSTWAYVHSDAPEYTDWHGEWVLEPGTGNAVKIRAVTVNVNPGCPKTEGWYLSAFHNEEVDERNDVSTWAYVHSDAPVYNKWQGEWIFEPVSGAQPWTTRTRQATTDQEILEELLEAQQQKSFRQLTDAIERAKSAGVAEKHLRPASRALRDISPKWTNLKTDTLFFSKTSHSAEIALDQLAKAASTAVKNFLTNGFEELLGVAKDLEGSVATFGYGSECTNDKKANVQFHDDTGKYLVYSMRKQERTTSSRLWFCSTQSVTISLTVQLRAAQAKNKAAHDDCERLMSMEAGELVNMLERESVIGKSARATRAF